LKEEGPDDKQDQSEYYQSGNFEKLYKKAKTDGKKMSTNLVQLVGHNAIRHGVVGLGGRPCNEDENKLSAYLLDESLEQGAWGLSLGLEYMPGVFADFNELTELGKVCSKHGVVITSHMRNEGDKVFESVDEMVRLSRETGARVHIAHLKICSKKLWGQAEKLFETIENANRSGASVTADMYPYSAYSTGIMNTLPDWAKEGGGEKAAKRLTSPGEERDRLYAHLNQRFATKDDGDRIYIVSTNGRYTAADDKTIGELSVELGLSVPDTVAKILIETNCRSDCIYFNMHDDDVFYLLAKDIAIGSDGSGRPYDPSKTRGKPHPRSYGTFPRFLRLRREKNLCPIETAIYRITKKPAGILGLKDRGLLKAGYIADTTVFDENSVSDTATFKDPFKKPIGIIHVVMNGRFAIKDGNQTEERLGAYILR
jgi:N-acyl-D-amino-acid deacylase